MVGEAVFIISEDVEIRNTISELVVAAGLCVETLPSLDAWLATAGPAPDGCLVLNLGPGDLNGPEQIARLTTVCRKIPVLVLVSRGDIPTAVCAVKAGAADVRQKPLGGEKLLGCIKAIAGKVECGTAS